MRKCREVGISPWISMRMNDLHFLGMPLRERRAFLAAQPPRHRVTYRPIMTARYPSNWELAAARASSVTRHLIEQGVGAGRVRVIGYADTRPRADNASPEGRARNRRVSFILRLPVR